MDLGGSRKSIHKSRPEVMHIDGEGRAIRQRRAYVGQNRLLYSMMRMEYDYIYFCRMTLSLLSPAVIEITQYLSTFKEFQFIWVREEPMKIKMKVNLLVLVFFLGFLLLNPISLQATLIAMPGAPAADKMVLTSEDDIPYHIWVAGKYLAAGAFDSAIQICRQVVVMKPEHIDAHACMAAAYKGLGSERKFEEESRLVKDLAPKSPSLYLLLASAYMAQKEIGKAEGSYKEGLRIIPDSTELRMGLAALYLKIGNLKQAAHLYREVENKGNVTPEHYLNAGFALCRIDLRLKEYDTVIKRAGLITELYPPIPQGYELLAAAFLGKGETKEAVKVFHELMAINPKTPVSWQELALIYAERLKNHKKALEYAQDAVLKFPDDPKSLDVLGWVYYQQEKYQEALTRFQAASSLAPDDPIFHYHLGLAFQKVGDKSMALRAFEQALNRLGGPDSENKFAKELRQMIEQCR